MDITTLQVVRGCAAKLAEPIDEQYEDAEPPSDDGGESETPELSIEQLEEMFSDLN
jgi:hypothetical protein